MEAGGAPSEFEGESFFVSDAGTLHLGGGAGARGATNHHRGAFKFRDDDANGRGAWRVAR